MDAKRIDGLARSLATRRRTLSAGGAGVVAAIAGKTLRAAAADATSCTMTITGSYSDGSEVTALNGSLELSVAEDGAVDQAGITLANGDFYGAVGYVTGRTFGLFVDLGSGQGLGLHGAGNFSIAECTGLVVGTVGGPTPGMVGSWTATAGASDSEGTGDTEATGEATEEATEAAEEKCPEASGPSPYRDSCQNIVETCTDDGTLISATCTNAAGDGTADSTIIVNSCADDGYTVNNCDGILTCGECG